MAKVCPHFETVDTPREAGARARRIAVKPTGGTSTVALSNFGKGKETTPKKRRREFNPNTYKFHALADYCSTIRLFGTTDNYNTQNVSCQWDTGRDLPMTYDTLFYRANGSTSASRYTMPAPTRTNILGSVPVMNTESVCSELFVARKRNSIGREKNTTIRMAPRTRGCRLKRQIHYLKQRLKTMYIFLSPSSIVLTSVYS
jgi:hypothetical protein